MPIYEYRCTQCQHKLESLQRFSDAPLVTCPACGKDALTKLVSAAGFQLKGSGWYQTDFRGGGSKKPDADKPASDTKPDAAKSDAPAATSDTTTTTPSTTSTPAASPTPTTTKAA